MAEQKRSFATTYGAPLPVHYDDDAAYREAVERLGLPGEPPFTRGVQPTMYRGRLWTMRQYAGFGTAEETNARFRYLLEHGQTGLSVAFDLPTQMGYDPDDPEVAGEVGKVGVSIAALEDLERLFEGIPLGDVTTSMTINATAAILLAMYVAVAKKQGVPLQGIGGTTQNDILKEYIARGTYIFPPRPSMRLATDLIAYCARHLPRWNPISISGYHIREAGADSVQELAFTFADAIAYVDGAVAAGLAVEEFAPQLSFFFAAHSTLLEEVAKFRAARRVWESIMRDRYGARSPAALALRFHTQTMGSTLTAQQPLNNIVRTAIEALAAVLGGTQSLHTNAYDEALALPTEESARVALRTQQIIAEETGAADTIDPLGGAYAIEALTADIATRVRAELEKIDSLGGALAAIERGYQMREIEESAYRQQRAVESGEKIVVGVNAFRSDGDEVAPALQRGEDQTERRRAEHLREVRAKRDGSRAERGRRDLLAAARGTANLVPPIVDAVEAGATLGEICADLRSLFGERAAFGGYTTSATDLALPGRRLGLSFTRWYNSGDPQPSPLGPGWTHSFNWKLLESPATDYVELRRGDGRVDRFTKNADQTYSAPLGVFDTLARSGDGSFTLTTPGQTKFDLRGPAATVQGDVALRRTRFVSCTPYQDPWTWTQCSDAVDGYDATYFLSSVGFNGEETTWTVDLSEPITVTSFRLIAGCNGTLRRYYLESSVDTTAWTMRYDSLSDKTAGDQGTITLPGGPFNARYWRMRGSGTASCGFKINTINLIGAQSDPVAGKLTKISEPAGNQITLSYSGGNPVSITDTVGRITKLSYG